MFSNVTPFTRTIVLVVMCSLQQEVSAQFGCGPSDRLLEGKCQPCPVCLGGTGLDEPCGFGVGAGAECQVCQDGRTHSAETTHGSRTCENCTACADELHRETVSECTMYQDNQCGVCLDGFYGVDPPENPQIHTTSCYPCAGSVKGEQPQCESFWQREEDEMVGEVKAKDQKTYAIVGGFLGAIAFITLLAMIIFFRGGYIKRKWDMWLKHKSVPEVTATNGLSEPESANLPQQAVEP